MRGSDGIDPLEQDSDLMEIVDHLIEAQKTLDNYGLSLISAHLEAALNSLGRHVPVPKASVHKMMEEFGLDEMPVEN